MPVAKLGAERVDRAACRRWDHDRSPRPPPPLPDFGASPPARVGGLERTPGGPCVPAASEYRPSRSTCAGPAWKACPRPTGRRPRTSPYPTGSGNAAVHGIEEAGRASTKRQQAPRPAPLAVEVYAPCGTDAGAYEPSSRWTTAAALRAPERIKEARGGTRTSIVPAVSRRCSTRRQHHGADFPPWPSTVGSRHRRRRMVAVPVRIWCASWSPSAGGRAGVRPRPARKFFEVQ